MYPNKYIAVKVIEKDPENTKIISKAKIIKVYDTLYKCKQRVKELRFFQKLYKENFEVIYGDYDDYMMTRCALDAFEVFGAIAFQMFEPDYVENVLKALEENKKK